MSNLFEIKFSGWGHSPECRAWVSKYFDYYVLDFAESGTLELSLDEAEPVQLSGPVAWLTFPGIKFEFGNRNNGDRHWNHRYISFYGSFADDLLQRKLFPMHYPIISIHNKDRFVRAFDELLNYLENPILGNDRAAIMLEGLLLQLHEQESEMKFDRMDSRIKKLVNAIKESPIQNWNFRDEAKKMQLSYSHLRKLFCDGINQPPNAFLIGERMNFAAKMLVNTNLTISEIAEHCGYEDIYYFNKSFKKHFDIPPGKFRQQAMSLR
jgi:AraC-like DNA-binding protein